MTQDNLENKKDQEAPTDTNEEKQPVASQEQDNQEGTTVEREPIDYKAELEEAKRKNEKIEKQLDQAEYNIEKLKKDKKEISDNWSFEDEETSKEDIRSVIKEELKSFKNDISSDFIDDVINNITDNQSERDLIKYHYENSIKQSGFDKNSIKNDIRKAFAISNEKRILQKTEELKAALKSKNTISSGNSESSASSGIEKSDYPDKLSDKDIAFLKSQGITPEKYNKINNK